jgi:hypothetical protein
LNIFNELETAQEIRSFVSKEIKGFKVGKSELFFDEEIKWKQRARIQWQYALIPVSRVCEIKASTTPFEGNHETSSFFCH